MRLPDGFVAPAYGKRSLAEIPNTVLAHFGAAPPGPALAASTLPPAALRDIERIVLLVVDGLGSSQLARLGDEGGAPALAALPGADITSVAPSTTAAALATLATGAAPLAHGILGYRMHLPQFGLPANMIRLRGVLGGDLESAGLDVASFLPQRTIFERLPEAGVRAEAITRSAFLNGALTRMIYRGTRPGGFLHAPDLFVAGRRALANVRGERAFLRLYYDGIDQVAHAHGPLSEEHDAEVAALDAAFDREFLRRVEDPHALLLVTADHGHLTVPTERVVRFADHPEFLEHLAVPPTGEGRFAYLHARPGRVDAARAYAERAWAEDALVASVDEAVDAGLFGPGPAHPEFARRAGDLVLLARSDRRFVSDYGIQRPGGHVGNHGGLSSEEMRVPLLWRRLG